MDIKYYQMIEENPIIAAVKDFDGLEQCCKLPEIKVVFILYGDIRTIVDIVKQIKEAEKVAVVHVDLIVGLNSKEIAVDYIRFNTEADGIISTKPALIKRGRELGLLTTLRIFLLDSLALETIEKQLTMAKPDAIEILPGLMPKIISRVCKQVKIPVIAGGLIQHKDEVMMALSAGAIAVSSTNQKVWKM